MMSQKYYFAAALANKRFFLVLSTFMWIESGWGVILVIASVPASLYLRVIMKYRHWTLPGNEMMDYVV